MYNVSELFKTYSKQYDRTIEAKIEIGSVTYGIGEVVSFSIDEKIQADEDFEIGTAIASKLELILRTGDSIASGSKISPYIRFLGSIGTTEWLKMGEFFIDSRTLENNVWKFTCYDKLIFGEQDFISSLIYPATMQAVWNECCTRLGVASHSSVTINPMYKFQIAPTGHKLREVLGFIAGAHAASVKMMKDGTIGLIKFNAGAASAEKVTASMYMKSPQTNSAKSVTKIVVMNTVDGDDVQISAGTGDTYKTLTYYNPYIDQTILNNMYSALNGIRYVPFTMEWKCLPYLELGDTLDIEQAQTLSWLGAAMPWKDADFPWGDLPTFKSILMSSSISYTGGLKATASSSAISAQKSETEFKGTISEQLNQLEKVTVREGKRYYGVTIRREDGINVQSTTGSTATFNSDKIEMVSPDGSGISFDSIAGKFKFIGDIIMKGGSISWENVDLPFEEYTDEKALEAWERSGYSTYITQNGVYTGTININTDAVVGDTITLGNPNSSHLDIKNDNGFKLAINNDDVLRFYSNALWCDGHLAIQSGCSIGVFTGGLNSPSWSSLITMFQNQVDIFSSNSGKSLNLYGSVNIKDRIGFFNTSPSTKQSANYPGTIATTQTAGSSYTSSEQNMLNNLKADIKNLRDTVNNLVGSLKTYGLV